MDDDPLMTHMLPRTLRRAFPGRLDLATATTPEDAAQLLREMRPDIVLCDFNLRASRTGLDVLAEAADVAPHSVRILFSGHTVAEIGDALATAPIHGFLEKPFRLDDLLDPFARLVREAGGADLTRASGEP